MAKITKVTPLPVGSRIVSYAVLGRWDDGEELFQPHDEEDKALDDARMAEAGGAKHVSVERRVEKIRAVLVESETIYGGGEDDTAAP